MQLVIQRYISFINQILNKILFLIYYSHDKAIIYWFQNKHENQNFGFILYTFLQAPTKQFFNFLLGQDATIGQSLSLIEQYLHLNNYLLNQVFHILSLLRDKVWWSSISSVLLRMRLISIVVYYYFHCIR